MGILSAVCGTVVLAWAAVLSFIDVRHRRLPNLLTVPGAAVIMLGAAAWDRLLPAVFGAAALGGVYLVIHLLDPAGLGGGDVKLAVGLGALTGALGSAVWVLAALAAPVLTAVAATVTAVRSRGRLVPHGPSMCVASMVSAALAVV